MPPGDDPSTEELRAQQAAREHDERERLEHADSEEERRAAARRAEKAAYLEEKLDEQGAADDE